MSEEITFLRSRGFSVTAGTGDFAGMWKVDGQYRSTGWVRDKVAGLKARSIRNAPEPVTLTGEAPLAIVSTVREGAAVADDRFRGLGADGVRECLEALAKPAGGIKALAAALGVPAGSLAPALTGRQKPTPAMVTALYGPSGSDLLPKWLELIAGGPVSVPVGPGSEADPGQFQAGPQPEPTPQLPSTPPLASDPAAEAAPAAEEAAAGDGAAASTTDEEITETAGPGNEEAGSDAPSSEAASPAAEPGAARSGQEEAGEAQDTPASDLSQPPMAQPAFWPTPEWFSGSWKDGKPVRLQLHPSHRYLPDEVAPWSKIEDRDLLPILKGKAAGMAAEIAEIEAEYAAGVRALEALSQRSRAIERRRAALIAAIQQFE